MINAIKLWFHKRKLSRLYLYYRDLQSGYDCGNHMFMQMCPEAYDLKKQIDSLYDTCQELEA